MTRTALAETVIFHTALIGVLTTLSIFGGLAVAQLVLRVMGY